MIDGKAALMIASTLAGAGMFSSLVYAWTKWIARPKPPAPDDSLRIRQLEHAYEMIAQEVERLGEAQRLAAALQTEQRVRAPSPARGSIAYKPMMTPR